MRKSFILWLAIISWGLALAQVPYFQIHALPEELADAGPDRIFESSTGFIWLGAERGLLQYDGFTFRPYFRTDSTAVQQVSALFEDSRGRLWIGYRDGAIFYLDERGQLQPLEPDEGLPAVPVTAFSEDGEQRLWFSTYGEGVYFFEGSRLYNMNVDDGLLGDDIYTMVYDGKGRLWAATDGGISICSFMDGEKRIRNITTAEGLPDDIVRTLLPDKRGNFWIGTYDHGFCYLHTDDWHFEYPIPDWHQGVVSQLELFEDRELWIGTENNGTWRYDLLESRLLPLDPERMAGTKVYDLHKDVEGNIWVLTNSQGLSSANRQFESIRNRVNNIQAVLVSKAGHLWAGTPEGLYRYERDSMGAGHYRRILPALAVNVISLYQDDAGRIWAGTFGNGVYCLDDGGRLLRHLTEKDGLANGSILSVDGHGRRVWLATLGGVTELTCPEGPDAGSALQVRNYQQESGLGANFIYRTFVDSRGRVWFGTDGKGISVLDNGKLTNYQEAGEVDIKSVYAITEDLRGHIWFSTAREGIFEFDGKHFGHLTVKEGIRDLAITGLITDAKGQILIVHPSGVDILDPETRHLIYYDREVNVQHIEPNLNALCKDDNGHIFIGTQHGIIRYTALNEQLSIHPRTQLTGVSLFLEAIDFHHQNSFAHNQNGLIFDFAGLWYTDPGTVKFRYRLDGFDHDWITTSDRRVIYSKLPPGTYTFKVTATENAAFDQEPVISYTFTIQAPFWHRWWFILLSLMAGGALAFGGIRMREQRLQREALLKKEKLESQFEALKSQINPHFLFNSFNTLITIIEENPKIAVQYVEKLSDFYRSILQYREMEVIPLEEELELVKDYAYLLRERYGNSFTLNIQPPKDKVFVAPLTLQMLVENAVKHNIISKTRPLTVDIYPEDPDYVVVANNLQKKLTPERSTGFGLQSIAKRYSLMVERKVLIEETRDHFKVKIPLIKNGNA